MGWKGWRRKWAAGALVGALATWAGASSAAPTASVETADALYQRAQGLVGEGKYAEALPLFEESQRLDPALGTQFAVADCREKLGQEVLAYRSYVALQRRAHEAGKPKLEQLSAERVKVLGPRMPRLRVVLEAQDTAVVVTVDGQPIGAGEVQVVEVGAHLVRAIGDGRAAWESRPVAVAGRTLDINVPKLAPVPAAPGKAIFGPSRVIGLVLTGAGSAGLVAGGVFGGLALSKRGDAEASCPDRTRCATQADADRWTSAASTGTISTVLVVAGAVVLAGGLVMYLTAPKSSVKGTAAALVLGAPVPW